jgi:hypothetical protein
MKFFAVALTLLAMGWCGSAQAAISPACRVLSDTANSANLTAKGGFASQFESRAPAADERENQQRLADAADAVQLFEASRAACAAAEDAAPLAVLARDVAPHQVFVAAALAGDDCFPVLSVVQSRLMELARGLEGGTAAPEMPHVLTGTMALNDQVRTGCKGDGVQLTEKFAEQGAALRKLHATVAVCGPAQLAYHQTLEQATAMVADASSEAYGAFLQGTYDPALKAVRTACGEILNTEVVDANDKKMRDFDTLKADALRAREASRPRPLVKPTIVTPGVPQP